MLLHTGQCYYSTSNVITAVDNVIKAPTMLLQHQQCYYNTNNVITTPTMLLQRQQCYYSAHNVTRIPHNVSIAQVMLLQH